MPPQAAPGFRYTPSSYLQRTRVENRPWTEDDGSDDSIGLSAGMRQEERPSRKGTHMDSQFASRIQKRKDMYRGILKGDVEPTQVEDEEESISERNSAILLTSDGMEESRMAQQAREARQRRLASAHGRAPAATTLSNGQPDDMSRVRNLRAQRLRSAKRVDLEEQDFSEVLKARRMEQREKERLEQQKQAEEDAQAQRWLQQQRRERERRAMEEEQRLVELTKKRQAERKVRKQPRKSPTSPVEELSIFEEVQLMLRETGLIQSCVSSCFDGDMDIAKPEMTASSSQESTGEDSFEPMY